MNGIPPIVIAHRGASGYMPEHSIGAKILAHGYAADYLEQDVIITRDNVPVVFHDLHLDELTDVATVFPGRSRSDGRHYVIDFTLDELRRLQLHERIDLESGKAHWPQRFKERAIRFGIVTLDEELALIKGLNSATRHRAGIYTEIKSPGWHRKQGKDSTHIILECLKKHGYSKDTDLVYLQCFDDLELIRIHDELGSELKLIQLIGENHWNESGTDYDQLRTAHGLKEISRYAQGIGPPIDRIAYWTDQTQPACITDLAASAHSLGLAVHPYTARLDQLPNRCPSWHELHKALFLEAGVDGLFSDFPDQTKSFIDDHVKRAHA